MTSLLLVDSHPIEVNLINGNTILQVHCIEDTFEDELWKTKLLEDPTMDYLPRPHAKIIREQINLAYYDITGILEAYDIECVSEYDKSSRYHAGILSLQPKKISSPDFSVTLASPYASINELYHAYLEGEIKKKKEMIFYV